jgi:hypothetical protein
MSCEASNTKLGDGSSQLDGACKGGQTAILRHDPELVDL